MNYRPHLPHLASRHWEEEEEEELEEEEEELEEEELEEEEEEELEEEEEEELDEEYDEEYEDDEYEDEEYEDEDEEELEEEEDEEYEDEDEEELEEEEDEEYEDEEYEDEEYEDENTSPPQQHVPTMLEVVLAKHRPPVWTAAAHYDRTFVTITLGCGETEYDTVVDAFKEMCVANVKRIQNPFIYGRFKLRKEQLERKSSTIYEYVMYHPIRVADAEIVAEYNCDYRRYPSSNGSQHTNKRPIFYKTPQYAKQRSDAHGGVCTVMVVVRVLSESCYVGETLQRDWDTEYVPEYIVELQ